MPVCVHLIDHPDGRILVDTGLMELHPLVADMDPRLLPLERAGPRPRGHRPRRQHPPALRPLRRQRPLRGPPTTCSAASSRTPARQEGYTIPEWVDAPGVTYVPVDGELELLAGVRLVPAPGHTARHPGRRRRHRRPPGRRRGDVAVWFSELDEPPPRASGSSARSTPARSGSPTPTSRGGPDPQPGSNDRSRPARRVVASRRRRGRAAPRRRDRGRGPDRGDRPAPGAAAERRRGGLPEPPGVGRVPRAPRLPRPRRAGPRRADLLSGDVAGDPPEPWAADEELLLSVGVLVRDLHTASAGYAADRGSPPRPASSSLAAPRVLLADLRRSRRRSWSRTTTSPRRTSWCAAAGGRPDRLRPGRPDHPAGRLAQHGHALGAAARPRRRLPDLAAGRQPRRLRLLADAYGLTAADRARGRPGFRRAGPGVAADAGRRGAPGRRLGADVGAGRRRPDPPTAGLAGRCPAGPRGGAALTSRGRPHPARDGRGRSWVAARVPTASVEESWRLRPTDDWSG